MKRVELHPTSERRIAIGHAAMARAKQSVQGARINPFKLPAVPPGVVPDGMPTMAMDNAITQTNDWSTNQNNTAVAFYGGLAYASAYQEGLAFPGYAFLAELAQRPEYRRMSETLAMEMTRKWIELQSAGDVDKTAQIKELNDELDRLCARDAFRKCVELDGFFGRSHLYIDTGDTNDRIELKHDIGNGRNKTSEIKIQPGMLKRLKPVEPVWTYPTNYDSIDPLTESWYEPNTWFVMGKEVHKSRLLKFVGREVPDLLKPAYSFGGLSMSQMAMPYVNNWLRTRQSVADIIHAFSVFLLKTDLSESLMQGGQQLFDRAEFFNALRDNKGLMLIDKDAEDFMNVSAPLGSLDALQAQVMEHMCLSVGTLIETQRGQVPIEEVTTADKVMTRVGLMSVKWSGITGYTDRLIEIHSGGNVIRCTPEHPIWSSSTNAFVNAKNVTRSHRLLVRDTNQENMVGQSHGVAIGGAKRKVVIIEIQDAVYSIVQFGKRIVALFRKVMKFITRMKITERTTHWITSNLLLVPNIWQWMDVSIDSPNAATFGNAKFVESNFELRTQTQNIAHGWNAGKLLENVGGNRHVVPSTNNVNVVRKFLRRAVGAMVARVRNFVRIHVGNVFDSMVMYPTRISFHNLGIGKSNAHIKINANVAETNSWQNSPERDSVAIHACGASVTAVRTRNMSHKEIVYNLEVDGPPEFFANNILVHNCTVSGIPIVKLLGIQPAGLNASSEGELRTFYDWVLAMQEKMIRPNLTVIIDFAMLNLWGKVDKEITFKFIPLWALDEKGLADVRASEAETDVKLIEAGVVSPLESRKRLAADPDSPYASIDVEDVPDLREEEEAGLEPHAGAAKLAEGAGEEEGEIDVPNRGAAGARSNGGPPHEQGDGLGGEHEADDSEPFETGELRPDYVEGKNPLADGATRRDAQPDHPGRGSPKNRELAAKALRRQQAGELDPDYLEGKDALGQSNPLLGKNPLAGKNRLKQSTLLRERAAQRNAANPDRTEGQPPFDLGHDDGNVDTTGGNQPDATSPDYDAPQSERGNEDDEVGRWGAKDKKK